MKPIAHPKLVLLWCVVLFFGVCTATGWFWLQGRSRQDEFETKLRETQITNDAFAEHTVQVITNVDVALSAVRAFYLRTNSVAETTELIRGLSLSKPIAGNIHLIDSRGRVVISHDLALKGIEVSDRDYFIYHRDKSQDQLYIGSVELGRVTGEYLFRVSRRIYNADGSFGGVVLVTLSPRAFSEYYSRLIGDAEGVASLVGINDRKIRARTPEPGNEVWQTPLQSPLWDFLDKAPAGHYRSKSNIDHIDRTFVYRKVGSDLPLVLGTAFSDRDVEQNISRKMLPFTIGAVAGVVFSALLTAILTVVLRQREEMRRLARIDVLTGLLSRRYFMSEADRELARAIRYGGEMSVLMVDVDHFKTINDTHGHQAGDRVLRRLGEVFRRSLRGVDLIGRVGGEEFAVVLPQIGILEAFEVAERLRRSVENEEASLENGMPESVTVSIGVNSLNDLGTSIDALLGRADRALYEAKSLGRNQVCVYEAGQYSLLGLA